MAWITLTEDNVRERLSWPELSAFKTWHLKAGQDDPVPETIVRVVNEVRGYVSGCARNVLGPAGTIPDSLADAALSLMRWRLATRLPGASQALLDESRKQEYDDALRLLRDVARCNFGIEPGADVSGDCASGNAGSGRWGGNPKMSF